MALVILEGCDGTGKTTLANQLKSSMNPVEIIHCTRETKNDFEFFAGIIEESRTRNIIVDRFFWGQFVYQKPEERKITPEQLHILEDRVKQVDGVIVYVTAATDVITARLEARGERTEKPVAKIDEAFNRLAKDAWYRANVLKYDTSAGGFILL